MENNKEEARRWLELFKVMVEKESITALSINDLVVNLKGTLDKLIKKCNEKI